MRTGVNTWKNNILESKMWINSIFGIQYFVLIIITIIVLLPLCITIFAAFKTPIQIGADFPLKPPTDLYLENFQTVIKEGKIFSGFFNSMFLVIASVMINTVMSSMTSYCIVRFSFKLKKILLALFMLGMIIPMNVTEIVRFDIMHKLGLYNTLYAPVVIYAAADLMQIYIYTQFLEKVPVSLDESAMIDGASYFGIFFKIIFPLLLPAAATLGILKTVDVINDMYIPYLYMPSAKLRTLTTTLMYFNSTQLGRWSDLSAAIILIAIPTILIYIFFQKYIFAGLTAGAVKE